MAAKRRHPKRDLTDPAGWRVGLYCRVSKPDPGNPNEREKSTEDQETVGREWIERRGAVLVEVYSDEGISASRFTRKQREEFNQLLRDIEAGALDAVWFWELSRMSRRPAEFHQLVDLCRDNGVVWVNQDRVVDPGDYKDMLQSGILAVVDATSSEQTSERVRRGMSSIAAAGKPNGAAPFGYRRRYTVDARGNRHLDAQEPDVWDGDGRPVEDSPAWVVREIFQRAAAGDSFHRIARDLTDRKIPLPRDGRRRGRVRPWYSESVKRILRNPAYIGKRVHQVEDQKRPETIVAAILPDIEVVWPPLVDESTWWTVYRRLTDPTLKRTRPAAARSLLSSLVTCAKCDGPLTAGAKGKSDRPTYKCLHRGCTGIVKDDLDDHVEEVMIRFLSDPDVYAELTKVDKSEIAAQARAAAAQGHAELEQLYRDAEAGEVSPVIATRRERVLKSQIEEAEQRAHAATMPAVLIGRVGPDAAKEWGKASNDIKRQMITAVAEIKLKPTGWTMTTNPVRLAEVADRAGVYKSTASQALNNRPEVSDATRAKVRAAADALGYTSVRPRQPIGQRVEWRWVIGPDAD